MKKSKVMLFGAMALTAGLALAACGSSQSSNADKTYSYIFVSNPDTLDYITSTRDSTSSITANLIDGLLENDQVMAISFPLWLSHGQCQKMA